MLFKKIFITFICICLSMPVATGCKRTGKNVGKPPKETTDKVTDESVTTSQPDELLAPIVMANGSVDEDELKRAEDIFRDIVTRLRTDGLANGSDISVEMDKDSIRADINLNTTTYDIELLKVGEFLILKIDPDFTWKPDQAEKINGIDPASYNKEMLMDILKMFSNTPEEIFDIIDKTYFSGFILDNKEWLKVGDCYIVDDYSEGDTSIVFRFKK